MRVWAKENESRIKYLLLDTDNCIYLDFKNILFLLFFLGTSSFLKGQETDYKKVHDTLPKISLNDNKLLKKIVSHLLNFDTSSIHKNIHLYYQDIGESYYKLYLNTKDTEYLNSAIHHFEISLFHKNNNSKVLYNISLCHYLLKQCESGSYYLEKYQSITPAKSRNTALLDSIPKCCAPSRNTIFFEFFGNAFPYSLNYERLFKLKEKNKIALRTGFHYSDNLFKNDQRIYSIPLEASWLHPISKKNNYLELGLGLIYSHDFFKDINHVDHYFFTSFRMGYRYQKRNGGFFFKAGFTPLYQLFVINPEPKYIDYKKWWPIGGLAFGYTFK